MLSWEYQVVDVKMYYTSAFYQMNFITLNNHIRKISEIRFHRLSSDHPCKIWECTS